MAEVAEDVTEYIFYEKAISVSAKPELPYTKALYFSWIKEGLETWRKNSNLT